MLLLVPGRHHALTDFQFKYLSRVIANGLQDEPDAVGNPIGLQEPITGVVWAVTSANHSNTRRNPVPFYIRAMALLDFSQELMVPSYVFGIDDVGQLAHFAEYTLKKIKHESEGRIYLDPSNCVVACSSPVRHMYAELGFTVLPMELVPGTDHDLVTDGPWDLVEKVAASKGNWRKDRSIFDRLHQSTYLIWTTYGIDDKIQRLFSDEMISGDGDLTTTRDYSSYVRQMDDIARLKYDETAPYIQPGRIGDIGCAVGTWIKLGCEDARLRESDFIGIEVARHLYQICLQRKENKEFANPFVFFAQRNAVEGLCFDRNSMNTVHTSSLTHEIESYGGRADLIRFIENRHSELVPGGVWINRDVVGPRDGERTVLLWLNDADAQTPEGLDSPDLKEQLAACSTRKLFDRFAAEFRAGMGDGIQFEWVELQGKSYAKMSLNHAMEFISKKDYHDNWQSEMHERFCFWDFEDWKSHLVDAGFSIAPVSRAYPNTWLIDNRYRGHVALFQEENGRLVELPFPETHMLMVAVRNA
ncbi:MAG: transferase [Bacteroidia bacterium]